MAVYIGQGITETPVAGNGYLQPKKVGSGDSSKMIPNTDFFYNAGAPVAQNGVQTPTTPKANTYTKKNQFDAAMGKLASEGQSKRDVAQTSVGDYRDVNFLNEQGHTTVFASSDVLTTSLGTNAATYNKGKMATYDAAMSKLTTTNAVSRAEYVDNNGTTGLQDADFKARNGSTWDFVGGDRSIGTPTTNGNFIYNGGAMTSTESSDSAITTYVDSNNNNQQDENEPTIYKKNSEVRQSEIDKIFIAGSINAMSAR